MRIVASHISKKFANQRIIKDFSYDFEPSKAYAIIGNNGSGKSTLLKILAGIMPFADGELQYSLCNKKIQLQALFGLISFVAPYSAIPEQLTARELIAFQNKFKPLRISSDQLLENTALQAAANQPIATFSSGMKQKLKLALAIFAQDHVLFLDEPTSHLDKANMAWYKREIVIAKENKLCIVASNDPFEYDFCDLHIAVNDYR